MFTILDADLCEESLKDTLLNASGESDTKAIPDRQIPVGIYFFKVNDEKPRKTCKICSKSTIKTLERRQWRRSSIFILN